MASRLIFRPHPKLSIHGVTQVATVGQPVSSVTHPFTALRPPGKSRGGARDGMAMGVTTQKRSQLDCREKRREEAKGARTTN